MTEIDHDLELIVIEPEDFVILDKPEVLDLTYLGCQDYQAFEAEVIRLTNKERISRSLPHLTRNKFLTQSALIHTVDMVEHRFISHSGSDGSNVAERVTKTGYKWLVVGENLAMGQRTPEEVIEGWLDSPGHRQNLLHDRFREIGVAYIEGEIVASNGTIWRGGYWTQNFGTPWTIAQRVPWTIRRIRHTLASLLKPREAELDIVILDEQLPGADTSKGA